MESNIIVLDSTVSSVTVYTDRAQVTRTATIQCSSGEHTCVFEDLPETIEEKSIQISGDGGAILKNVGFKQVYFSETPNIDAKKLQLELQAIMDEIAETNDRMVQIDKEKSFIEAITRKLTAESEETSTSQLEPEKWINMVDFYRTKMSTLDKEIRETSKIKRDLDNQRNKLQRQISAGGKQNKTRNQVEIIIECMEEGEQSIELSYIVFGAQWNPYYDLRVSSDEMQMELGYKAIIRQNTSESWNDVDIQLSTAQANVNGRQPEMNPWRLEEYIPPVASSIHQKLNKNRSAPTMQKQMMPMELSADVSEEFGEEFDDLVNKPSAPMPAASSIVETKASSVVFNIAGKNTVPNDNNSHNVTVLIQKFPTSFRYSCVPKLSQYAYLKALVKNTSEYPFLAGETNIFMDNHFVATANMDLVAPTEEFWTYLGIDEGMKVEHKFIKRHKNESGVFSKTASHIYEYKVEITNNKKSKSEIVVWDQLPISGHEKIEIKLLEPEIKKDCKTIKINEYQYIEWLFEPKPGEVLEIPFKFSVEHPIDMKVRGL